MRRSALCLIAAVALVPPLAAQEDKTATEQESVASGGLGSLADLLAAPVTAASRYAQSAREAPAAVSVITSEEIRLFGFTTVLEAVEHQAGMFSSNDHQYGYFGIRGLLRPSDYNNRVLFLIDGVPINEAAWGSVEIHKDQQVPIEIVERIEIARGPGSSIYGGNAMFAVINVVTKTAASFEGVRASVTTGSLGYEGISASFAQELSRGTDVVVSVEVEQEDGAAYYWEELDDPYWNFGRADGLDWMNRESVFTRIRHNELSVTASYNSFDKGIPTGAWETLLDDGNYTLDRLMYVSASNTWSPDGAFTVDADLGYFDYLGIGDYIYEAPSGVFDDDSKARWIRGNVSGQWDAGADTRILVGADYQKDLEVSYYVADEEAVYQDIDLSQSWGGVFAQAERQLSRSLGLTAGLRYDGHSAGFSGFSPRLAAVVHPWASHTFKLLYGTAFRAPSPYEHSYQDLVFYQANSDVAQERIKTLELWWETSLGSSTILQASAYHFWLEDLIDEVWNEETELLSFDNVDEVSARGLELRIRGEIGQGLDWYFAGTLQRAHFEALEDDGLEVDLPNSPHRQLRAGLSYRLGSRAYLSGTLKAESSRKTVYDDVVDGYWTANATLGLPSLAGDVGGRITVSNLFDREYRLPGGWEHEQVGLLQRGRTISVALTWAY